MSFRRRRYGRRPARRLRRGRRRGRGVSTFSGHNAGALRFRAAKRRMPVYQRRMLATYNHIAPSKYVKADDWFGYCTTGTQTALNMTSLLDKNMLNNVYKVISAGDTLTTGFCSKFLITHAVMEFCFTNSSNSGAELEFFIFKAACDASIDPLSFWVTCGNALATAGGGSYSVANHGASPFDCSSSFSRVFKTHKRVVHEMKPGESYKVRVPVTYNKTFSGAEYSGITAASLKKFTYIPMYIARGNCASVQTLTVPTGVTTAAVNVTCVQRVTVCAKFIADNIPGLNISDTVTANVAGKIYNQGSGAIETTTYI